MINELLFVLASASFIESNMLIRGLEMDNFIKRSKGALISQDVSFLRFLLVIIYLVFPILFIVYIFDNYNISKKKYTYKVTQGVKLTDLEVFKIK